MVVPLTFVGMAAPFVAISILGTWVRRDAAAVCWCVDRFCARVRSVDEAAEAAFMFVAKLSNDALSDEVPCRSSRLSGS